MLFHSDQYSTYSFFFFNDTATTEIYTLSLHDALPIYLVQDALLKLWTKRDELDGIDNEAAFSITLMRNLFLDQQRSEEHTSELQSRQYLVCRLLLEKKK